MKLASSLNNCLKQANGLYIASMDADDISLPERLEIQIKYMIDHPEYDCVGSDRIIFGETGEIGVRKSVEYPTQKILLKDVPFAHPTIMMKREVYDKLEGYTASRETMRSEDYDLWFRFYANGYKGYNIQTPLYKYRESLKDFKKRNLQAGVHTSKVYLRGYKLLRVPLPLRIFALKPIVIALIPNRLMKAYHKAKINRG